MFQIILMAGCMLLNACVVQSDQDLLAQYAQRHPSLELMEVSTGEGQVIQRSLYRVAAREAQVVEDHLVEAYGMGRLKFACCGWEPEGGRSGVIADPGLLKEGRQLLVTMYGNAEKEDDQGALYIEKDRNKIDHFNVEVTLVEI